MRENFSILPIVGLAIGIIHAALPMGEYNEYLCEVIKNLISTF